jgi:hypothetical protein
VLFGFGSGSCAGVRRGESGFESAQPTATRALSPWCEPSRQQISRKIEISQAAAAPRALTKPKAVTDRPRSSASASAKSEARDANIYFAVINVPPHTHDTTRSVVFIIVNCRLASSCSSSARVLRSMALIVSPNRWGKIIYVPEAAHLTAVDRM